MSASFHLYDLKVEVIEGDKPFVCSHQLGDAFEVIGENLHFKTDRPFSLYALAAFAPTAYTQATSVKRIRLDGHRPHHRMP